MKRFLFGCVLTILSASLLFAASDTLRITITIDDAVGVDDEGNIIPEKYEVYAPYPNPFNPTVTVQVDIPQSTTGTIAIYDVLGRHVAQLHHGMLTPGRYQYRWDGTEMTSGMYFLRVSTSLGTETFKLLLLK